MDEPEFAPPLRRRNSIATSGVIPTKLSLPSKTLHTSSLPVQDTNGNCNGAVSSSPPDFELVSLKSSLSYISLKDILPSSAVNSPTAAVSTCGSACEISIRNRLVKQAAWAYLQPMSSSPDASSQNFIRRLCLRFSARNPIGACIRFVSVHVIPCITGAFDWILRTFCVHINR